MKILESKKVEVSSILRNKVFRGYLADKEGGEVINLLKQLDISFKKEFPFIHLL